METEDQFADFQRHYMPIRFAGPLVTKLNHRYNNLRYWEHAHVLGKPLIFAIHDFHAPGSMAYSSSALPIYLYGIAWREVENGAGQVTSSPEVVEKHIWGQKEIESGFFYLDDAENISAVIINPSATISKFNRMGLLAGFGRPDIRLFHRGLAATGKMDSAVPIPFSYDVHTRKNGETWIEGMSVYHNPNALVPLKPELLPGAAHHFLNKDGTMSSLLPDWHPVVSETIIAATE
ncbi:hypothetical protein O0880_10485 [Janthinobacterium sp. SUN118]|uniref:hypothetical protein n=1 Tax=Janthinobacterium sp. SUN118 TaxID=3004100 RepID=UPI0025B183B8|nr:hypothetical protein [Janthinobacterium sp. SUN118]MDN2709842.1 hypothetical protein [Janthinobacterium sp. SUN118]